MDIRYKPEWDELLDWLKIRREKRQQTLNHKRTMLSILPQEIDGIENEIVNIDKMISYIERLQK